MDAINRAIESAGGQAALAARLRVSPGLIGHWSNGRRAVPLTRCAAIEAETGVRADELRPDAIWQRQRGRITGYTVPVKAV